MTKISIICQEICTSTCFIGTYFVWFISLGFISLIYYFSCYLIILCGAATQSLFKASQLMMMTQYWTDPFVASGLNGFTNVDTHKLFCRNIIFLQIFTKIKNKSIPRIIDWSPSLSLFWDENLKSIYLFLWSEI